MASPRIVIIGGGFNGRLLQHLLPTARVLDWRDKKPEVATRQLGPQYLWEPIEGLPCRHFTVTTVVDGRPATDESIRRYKAKVGKEQDGGDWRAQFQPLMAGYDVELPPDTVEYGCRVQFINPAHKLLQLANGELVKYDYLLSTIPLFSLAGFMAPYAFYSRQFKFRTIYIETSPLPWWWRLHPPMWQGGMRVNYIADVRRQTYRETWRDGQLFRESLTPGPNTVKVVPGKIYDAPHASTLLEALARQNIHCFGRFAAWRPDELAHETYNRARIWAEQEGLV